MSLLSALFPVVCPHSHNIPLFIVFDSVHNICSVSFHATTSCWVFAMRPIMTIDPVRVGQPDRLRSRSVFMELQSRTRRMLYKKAAK